MTLNDFGLDAEHLVALIGGLGFALLIWSYDDRFRQNAKTHDHVAEFGRYLDPVIPQRCIGCGSHHATHPVEVRRFRHGVSAITIALDSSYNRRFTFLCCLDCSCVIRRRRRLGRIIMGVGVVPGAHIVLSLLVAIAAGGSYQTMQNILPHYGVGWLFDLRTWPLEMLAGMFIFIFGFWLTLYSPYVTVLDTGGPNIFFRFRNQHFRDAFAELNGEEVAAVANR
jgi:hypothetical protein